MTKRNSIAKIMESAPPADPVAAVDNNLYYQFKKRLAPHIDIIADKLVEKATEGDIEAIRLAISVIKTTQPSAPTHMQQAVIVNGKEHKEEKVDAVLREQLVRVIADKGPLPLHKLAKEVGQTGRDIAHLLVETDLFEKEADGWHITNAARQMVLGAALSLPGAPG
jgi:hypothetical protein